MTTYYLSGPMRGYPDLNFPAFQQAVTQLRQQGFDVISPHEMGEPDATRGVLMGEDLVAILKYCDAVILLPGWEHSPGAAAEVAVAFSTEKPIYEIVSLGEMGNEPHRLVLVPSAVTSVTVPREEQYRAKIPLIGLCGFAQSGKDTVAEHLTGNRGWTRVAFADKLRDVLYALNPILPQELEPGTTEVRRLQHIVDQFGWDVAKTTHGEIRLLLQRLGTEAGRQVIDDNLWVSLGEQQIEAAGAPVVVTDCRFPNEVQMIKRRGGILIWIHRPGVEAVNGHASEHSVTADDCQRVIVNDRKIYDLNESVDRAVDDLFGARV